MGKNVRKGKNEGLKITRQGLYPARSLIGHDDGSPPDDGQVELCRGWLRERARPSRSVCKSWLGCELSSYALKHVVEGWLRGRGEGAYIANGAFIEAAVREGYRWRPVRPGSPNAVFYMAAKKKKRGGA